MSLALAPGLRWNFWVTSLPDVDAVLLQTRVASARFDMVVGPAQPAAIVSVGNANTAPSTKGAKVIIPRAVLRSRPPRTRRLFLRFIVRSPFCRYGFASLANPVGKNKQQTRNHCPRDLTQGILRLWICFVSKSFGKNRNELGGYSLNPCPNHPVLLNEVG